MDITQFQKTLKGQKDILHQESRISFVDPTKDIDDKKTQRRVKRIEKKMKKTIDSIPNACDKLHDATKFINENFKDSLTNEDKIEMSINHVLHNQHLPKSKKFMRDTERYNTIVKQQSLGRNLKNIKKPVEYLSEPKKQKEIGDWPSDSYSDDDM